MARATASRCGATTARCRRTSTRAPNRPGTPGSGPARRSPHSETRGAAPAARRPPPWPRRSGAARTLRSGPSCPTPAVIRAVRPSSTNPTAYKPADRSPATAGRPSGTIAPVAGSTRWMPSSCRARSREPSGETCGSAPMKPVVPVSCTERMSAWASIAWSRSEEVCGVDASATACRAANRAVSARGSRAARSPNRAAASSLAARSESRRDDTARPPAARVTTSRAATAPSSIRSRRFRRRCTPRAACSARRSSSSWATDASRKSSSSADRAGLEASRHSSAVPRRTPE